MWKRLACNVMEHMLWRACLGACALRRGENIKSMRSCCITKQLIWEDCFWGFEEEYILRVAESAEKMTHVTCYVTVNAFNETRHLAVSPPSTRTGRKPVNRDLCTLCIFEPQNHNLVDHIANAKPLYNHCTVCKRVILSRTKHNRAWNQQIFTTVYTHKPEHILIY